MESFPCRPFPFSKQKANPLRNELEFDNTRDRLFPTYFMLKAIGSLLNVNN
jgi:hypothetical protein